LVEEEIRRSLEKIRPSVQMDGGDIEFVGVDDGVVTVRLFGACEGCPMSPVTLRAGIERLLREEVPAVREVVALEA
jgi:Fe-S cluster biogenesis protein NfuA